MDMLYVECFSLNDDFYIQHSFRNFSVYVFVIAYVRFSCVIKRFDDNHS